MCGNVYVMRKDGKPAYKSVLKRYRRQAHRGSRGFGYVAIHNGHVVSYQRAENFWDISKLMEKETAEEIMFHHRMPTSTPNTPETAHPFFISNKALKYDYYWQHNGVIRNTKDLRKEHEKLGFEYNTVLVKSFVSKHSGVAYEADDSEVWNDSESIAIEASLAVEKKKLDIDTEGTAAIIGLQLSGTKVINRLFVRNSGNPLNFHEDKVMLTLTSEGAGSAVPDVHMYKLLKEGGYTKYGVDENHDIESPVLYKPTVSGYNTTPVRAWNNKTQTFEQMPLLPGHRRERMGFVPPPYADEMDFDLRGGDREIEISVDADERSLDEIAQDIDELIADKHIESGLSNAFLNMTKNDLYEEFEKCLEAETALEHRILLMDEQVREGILSNDILIQREKLQTKLDGLKGYSVRLDIELTTREMLIETAAD